MNDSQLMSKNVAKRAAKTHEPYNSLYWVTCYIYLYYRGQIVPNTGKVPPSKVAPVVCTHTAEGHTKAVLSLDATEDLLFTSSKGE